MKDKEKKICIVVKAFLENPNYTNEELSALTGISSSSVQRYLNNPIIKELFNEETFNKIRELIDSNIVNARKKGGINYFKNNEAKKDDEGKFVGSEKSTNTNRLEKKCNDILIFSNMFLQNPNLTLQQIADFYNENYPYKVQDVTRDYVYDCLSSKESYNLLADNLYDVISKQLEERRIIGNKNGADITNKKSK